MINRLKMLITLLGFVALTACTNVQPDVTAKLKFDIYNPQQKSVFPVTSTLISGPHEAILFDAQFQTNDAEQLVNMIKASGKVLTTIYISHGDPDFYFGLDVIQRAFPDAKIVATPATVKKIKQTMQAKLAYWGPILKHNAPQRLVLPQALKSDTLMLDGVAIEIKGFNGHDPLHTFAWLESEQTILGGVMLMEAMHLWMADNQTTESRDAWIKSLDNMLALQPKRVIAGHYIGRSSEDKSSIEFSKKYIQSFETSQALTPNAKALTASMLKQYPNLAEEPTLVFSAKVVKGDIKWPQ